MAGPVSVVKDYDPAWNAYDVEGVMAFFTDDAVVRMELPPLDKFGGVYTGKDQNALASSSRITGGDQAGDVDLVAEMRQMLRK